MERQERARQILYTDANNLEYIKGITDRLQSVEYKVTGPDHTAVRTAVEELRRIEDNLRLSLMRKLTSMNAFSTDVVVALAKEKAQ